MVREFENCLHRLALRKKDVAEVCLFKKLCVSFWGPPQFTSGKAEADGLELALCHSQPLCLQKSVVLFCLCLILNDFVSLFNFYFSHLRDDAFLDKPLNVLVFFFSPPKRWNVHLTKILGGNISSFLICALLLNSPGIASPRQWGYSLQLIGLYDLRRQVCVQGSFYFFFLWRKMH